MTDQPKSAFWTNTDAKQERPIYKVGTYVFNKTTHTTGHITALELHAPLQGESWYDADVWLTVDDIPAGPWYNFIVVDNK